MRLNPLPSDAGKYYFSDRLQKWVTVPTDIEFLERLIKLEEASGIRFEPQPEKQK